MPQIKFTKHLNRFFPNLQNCEVEGNTVAEIIDALELKFPGLSAYIVDEHGALRQHVNIFIDQHLIEDPQKLSDKIEDHQRLFIFQALSGG